MKVKHNAFKLDLKQIVAMVEHSLNPLPLLGFWSRKIECPCCRAVLSDGDAEGLVWHPISDCELSERWMRDEDWMWLRLSYLHRPEPLMVPVFYDFTPTHYDVYREEEYQVYSVSVTMPKIDMPPLSEERRVLIKEFGEKIQAALDLELYNLLSGRK